jgi:transcriptional regulator with XRE-family HTH domain
MAAEHTQRIGTRIRQRREALGMTQADLAAKVGGKTDAQQISKWERGQHKPGDDRMERIAVALDVSPVYFMAPEPKDGTPNLIGALAERPAQAADDLQALRQDVAALREDVAEITAIIRQLLDPGQGLLQAQAAIVQHTAEPAPKPAARKQRRGDRREAT